MLGIPLSIVLRGSSPSYYSQRRPDPKGYLSQLSTFDITLDSDDLCGDISNVKNTTVTVLRPGFSSTHAVVRYTRIPFAFVSG